MKTMIKLFVALTLLAPAVSAVEAATYDVDPAHSNVGFSVTHLMVSKVIGKFNDYSGTFEFDPKDPKKWKVDAVVQAKSIDTGIGKRDDHLRSDDFFAVEKNPTLTFKSKSVSKAKDGTYALKGDLTMRGVTKPVTFKLIPNGEIADKTFGERTGFSATATVKRSEFGLKWNKAIEAGGVAVSDDVEIKLEVEGIKQAAKEPAKAAKKS